MTTLNLKAFVQGNAIDRVINVELFNTQKELIAQNQGSIGINGNCVIEFNETIIVPVRIVLSSAEGAGNAILKTASSALISPVNGLISYDFSIDIAQAMGANQANLGDSYALFNGDFNQDGSIDGSDVELFENNENNEQNEIDKADLENNVLNSIFSVLE